MSAAPIILPYNGIMPTIHPDAWIAPGAVVIGDVHIGAHSSVWFGCVIRGDVNHIRIGERTNVQDNSVIHVTRKTHPTIIGSGITIGHQAMMHGCILEDDCFIGMKSCIMDGATVESGAMVAACANITPGKTLKSGELWAGNPAKYFRDLKQQETDFIALSSENYVKDANSYKS